MWFRPRASRRHVGCFDAARIVANRPYASARGLLRKDVIGENKYNRIESYVYAGDRR